MMFSISGQREQRSLRFSQRALISFKIFCISIIELLIYRSFSISICPVLVWNSDIFYFLTLKLGFILLPGGLVWSQSESVHRHPLGDSFWLRAGQNQTVYIIYFGMYVFSDAFYSHWCKVTWCKAGCPLGGTTGWYMVCSLVADEFWSRTIVRQRLRDSSDGCNIKKRRRKVSAIKVSTNHVKWKIV